MLRFITRTVAFIFLVGLMILQGSCASPTAAQKSAARIQTWPPAGTASLFPAKVLFDYRPLLRMDNSVSIRPLQVETKRTAKGGLISTIWARRAQQSIVVDWGNDSVVNANVDNIKSAGGPVPQYVPFGMLMGGAGDNIILKLDGTRPYKIPWNRNSDVYPFALDERSDYAFGSEKVEASGRIESIVVVSISEKKVAGTIPVPYAKNGLHCIFEPNDYLMVFDYESQWIMLLDLKKPATPENVSKQSQIP